MIYRTPTHILDLIHASDPTSSTADPIRLSGREDGDKPARGNGSAVEGGGPGAPRPACLCGVGDRAGVQRWQRLPGHVLLAVAALGWLAIGLAALKVRRARRAVRTYQSGECPL